MVARVLFPVLAGGGPRSRPQHRATIKALPSPHHPPSPLRTIRPPVSLPGLGSSESLSQDGNRGISFILGVAPPSHDLLMPIRPDTSAVCSPYSYALPSSPSPYPP